MLRHPDESLRNKDRDALVQNHDIAPTVLEIAGIAEDSEGMDGQSLMGLITDRETVQRDFVITGWNDYASVRDDEWNYVTNWIAERPQPELYHLRSDPEEADNVHEQHREVATSFQGSSGGAPGRRSFLDPRTRYDQEGRPAWSTSLCTPRRMRRWFTGPACVGRSRGPCRSSGILAARPNLRTGPCSVRLTEVLPTGS